MHEARLFHTSLRGDGEHHGGDLIYGRDVENQFLVDGDERLPFERDEDERRGRREAFVPAGEWIIDCGFDD